jgi:hypothetical protein
MELPALSRRVFLRRSLRAVGALALLPGLELACAPGGEARAPADLAVVGPGEWAVLDAVADAFVPAGGAFEAGARSVELPRRIDRFLAGEAPETVQGVASALWVVEWVSPLLAGRPGRFSRMDLADRTRCIEALMQSRLAIAREIYAGLKQLCLFQFYAADASWPAIGYDGPWVGRVAR